jgi:ABC-2 type transport system ATP-binding protein
MRALVKRLADSGLTVLLSSHDMVEVEEICDNVTIMREGTVAFHGGIRKLRGMAPDPGYRLATSADDRVRALAAPPVTARPDPEGGLVVTGPHAEVQAYVAAVVGAGIELLEFRSTETPLEALFFMLTGATREPAEPAEVSA